MTSGQGVQEHPVHQLVTEQHLVDRLLRSLTTVEKAAARAWLEDAWEEVYGRVPALTARRDAGLVTDGQLRKVLAAMVVRVLRNPEAIRQYTIDDGTLVRDEVVSGGLLYVTDDDVALLAGVTAAAAGGEVTHISFSVPYQ